MAKKFELHKERLATTDEKGRRIYLYPEDVTGKWKTRRTFLYWCLILFYLVLPWTQINGKQTILLNIPAREFTFFGTTFLGHDAPIFVFILIGFVVLAAFVTSIWGRAWCGWACPQTVFIDALFRKIEKLVEGKSRQREALDKSPWTKEKIFKRSFKWFLFSIVSLHIAHSFLGYFVGTRELFWITMSPPEEHWGLFITMLICSGIILFDFGWFREQFCIIACPYGRFQSVFMDKQSYGVVYDVKRGEPRRGPEIQPSDEGDCINCYQCVKVCPTGIDIRRGTQLECIACTMCIDACDTIMRKVDKPEGLIRYDSEDGLEGKPQKKFSWRSVIYLAVLLSLAIGFVTSLSVRQKLDIDFLRGSKSPYQEIKLMSGQSEIVNHYKINFKYQGKEKFRFYFEIENKDLRKEIKIVTPFEPFILKNKMNSTNVFFRFDKTLLNKGSRKIKFKVLSGPSKEKAVEVYKRELSLVGPL